jgi:hypothetical protein
MNTTACTQPLRQRWRRLAKWQRRLLIVVAVLVCSAWAGIGSIVLLVLLDSPLGCPPTMGCPERSTSDCSSWNKFMQPTDRVCVSPRLVPSA